MEKKRFYNVDFLRFIFCISIILLHFSSLMLRNISSIEDCVLLRNRYSLGAISVDFFFIISGFFWGWQKERFLSLKEFTVAKLIRLLPVMYFCLLLFWICALMDWCRFQWNYNIESIFLLTGIGITKSNTVQGLGNLHQCWYVSALFWVSLFYQYISLNYSKKSVNLFVALVIVLGYGAIITAQDGRIYGRISNTYFGIFNLGIMRALCGIGIGYFIANFVLGISQKQISFIYKIGLSIINVSCLCCLFYSLFFNHWLKTNDIFFILLFVIVMFCFTFNQDYISKLLNNKYLGFAGKYAYSIYVFHALPMDLFEKYLFTTNNISVLTGNIKMWFGASVIITITGGILIYYLIEKPITKYFQLKINEIGN